MRMLDLAVVTLAVVLPSEALAAAQQPADARMQRFIGSWRGEGTLDLMAGARSVAWHGTSDFEWAVGGGFVRQRVWVEPSDAIPNGIEALAFYCSRPTGRRYDLFWIDSLGHMGSFVGQWDDDATFVAVRLSRFAGLPRVDRQIVRIDPQGGFRVEMQAAVGTAPLGNEIVARFVRQERGQAEPDGATQPGPELAAFTRLARSYTVTVDEPGERRGWHGTLRGEFVVKGVGLRCDLALAAPGEEAKPNAVVFFGWDAERRRATYAVLDRDGRLTSGTATWPTPDVLVLVGGNADSEHFERVTVTFAADGGVRCAHDVMTEAGTHHTALSGVPAR